MAELDPAGTVIHAYGYGASGLMQCYYPLANNASFYIAYSFDPFGNLLQRHRMTDANLASESAVYDAQGMLWQAF